MAGGASRTDGVLWGCFLWQRLDSRPPKTPVAAAGRWELFWMGASRVRSLVWGRRRVLGSLPLYNP